MSPRNPKSPATTKVYEHSTATGKHFEMLMSVAVFANPDGSSCFPSVAKITEKRFGATARYGYKLIADLKAAGELEEVEKRPGRPTQYRVVCCSEDPSPGLSVVLEQQRTARRAKATPDPQESRVGTAEASQGYPGPPGVTPTPDPAKSPNHSVDHSSTSLSSPYVTVLREGEGSTDVQQTTAGGVFNGVGRASRVQVGISAPDEELPEQLLAVFAEFPGLDRAELVVQWKKRLGRGVAPADLARLRSYCRLRIVGLQKRNVAADEAFGPRGVVVPLRADAPAEAVA